MEKVLPNNLNYSQIKPIGYPSQIKQEKFTPVSFSSASMSDIIRFNISTNGFWDPYSAYIKIEVDTQGMDSIGVQCLDTSAHSFISQLIISNQGTEIERIEEYDTLSSILVDMSYSPESRSSRKYQGISSISGVTNDRKYTNIRNNCTSGSNGYSTGYVPNQIDNFGGYSQTYVDQILTPNLTNRSAVNSFVYRYEQGLSFNPQTGIDQATQQYLGPTSIASTVQLGYDGPHNLTDWPISGFNPAAVGYYTPYNYSLSSGSNEEVLSPNYIFQTTQKGNPGAYATKQKATFCIPLISGLLGILMPQQSYKYIPMKALQQLILEFRLNPYALFTSGYQDTSSTQNVNTVNQIRRYWKITKFELNVEMQYFESNLENIILSQLNSDKGIILHSSSWQLGPRYQIGAGQSPNGIYQVNLGFESLRNVLWCYLPDDWQTYNYCRKQYRINGNTSQYYIKIGTDYYPSLPITGHAGNPLTYGSTATTGTQIQNVTPIVDSDLNNSEFLIQLYKVFGRYNDITVDAFIDPVNFAINDRIYDPAATGALQVSNEYSNIQTAGGNPLFHEQRCVGKAVYALNLETLNNDFSVISGINTINNRPFEINIKSDTTNARVFQRPYTMYVFCQYDMLIQLKSTGVQVLGRG